jgi:hypothetical protein
MQSIAGRTGQEYNQRKNRKGAFWEDRYHATAAEADHHLIQCMVYIDLNMVRAGVVTHPSEWPFSGYNEIQNPRQRYSLIDHGRLRGLLDIKSMEGLKRSYREWVEESLAREGGKRESRWTESIAVGSKAFVDKTKAELGIKAIGREVRGADGVYELREGDVSYNPNFAGENSGLRPENSYFWNLSI